MYDKNTVEAKITLLEEEFSQYFRHPIVEVPESQICFEDTVEEFREFNFLDLDTISTLDIARLSDPYIMMPNEAFCYVLPKFFKAINREGKTSDMAVTVLGDVLLDFKSRMKRDNILSKRQTKLIYEIACQLEQEIFSVGEHLISDELLAVMLQQSSKTSNV